MVHLHNGILLGLNGILLGHKREGNLSFYDSMDEPGEYYAK